MMGYSSVIIFFSCVNIVLPLSCEKGHYTKPSPSSALLQSCCGMAPMRCLIPWHPCIAMDGKSHHPLAIPLTAKQEYLCSHKLLHTEKGQPCKSAEPGRGGPVGSANAQLALWKPPSL